MNVRNVLRKLVVAFCLVTLIENGKEVELKTTERPIETILETAAALGKPIEYMADGGSLTRAKRSPSVPSKG